MGKQAYRSQVYARTLVEYPEIIDIFEIQIFSEIMQFFSISATVISYPHIWMIFKILYVKLCHFLWSAI